jgi:hypothetical protein
MGKLPGILPLAWWDESAGSLAPVLPSTRAYLPSPSDSPFLGHRRFVPCAQRRALRA